MSKEIWIVVGLLVMMALVLIISTLLEQSSQNLQSFVSNLDLGLV